MQINYQGILTVEAALKAVKQDGYALRYVKDQTEAVAIEAVKQNGDALRYVKDQTEAVAIEAVKQNGYALQFVLSFDLFVMIANKLSIEISE